jgi:hypothetical protein
MKSEITNPMFKYALKIDTQNIGMVLVQGDSGKSHEEHLSTLMHADDSFIAFKSEDGKRARVYPLASVIRISVEP